VTNTPHGYSFRYRRQTARDGMPLMMGESDPERKSTTRFCREVQHTIVVM